MQLTEYTSPDPGTSATSPDDHVTSFARTLIEQDSIMNTEPARSRVLEPREPDSPGPPGEPGEPADLIADAASERPARTPVARCADGHGTLSALFFSDNVIDIARAKAMCGLCPLTAECLAGALEREEPWGVWGGELLSGGRIIANKRPCGRPPKHPRPELVVDELGPVDVPRPEPVAVG